MAGWFQSLLLGWSISSSLTLLARAVRALSAGRHGVSGAVGIRVVVPSARARVVVAVADAAAGGSVVRAVGVAGTVCAPRRATARGVGRSFARHDEKVCVLEQERRGRVGCGGDGGGVGMEWVSDGTRRETEGREAGSSGRGGGGGAPPARSAGETYADAG